jgi:hypothetical protein
MNYLSLDLEIDKKSITEKLCTKCSTIKLREFFPKHINRPDGMGVWCSECNKLHYQLRREDYLKQKKEQYKANVEVYSARNRSQYEKVTQKRMFITSKGRAKKRNVPFDIELHDIIVPEFCPVLGIKLELNFTHSKFSSPSLDRIIPEKWYVKGNIIVISLKANQIKNCSTIDELQQVYEFYNKLIRGA